jgi:hypothetical protein
MSSRYRDRARTARNSAQCRASRPPRASATGAYSVTSHTLPLAEHWNGTGWAAQQVPVSAGTTVSFLGSVACVPAGTCFAIDDFQAGIEPGHAQIERWNGNRWTAQPIQAPPGSQGITLGAISCSAAAACTATGWYYNSASLMTALAERYS